MKIFPRTTFQHWLVTLSVFVLFTAYCTYVGFMQPHPLGSDQQNLGVMVAKKLHPNLFSRDYVFKDTQLFQFYSPLYLRFIEWLISYTNDYVRALLVLLPIIMLVYLVGMFVLISCATESTWIAISISLVSSFSWWVPGGEVWGGASLQMVMPRAFFTALTPYLSALILWWFKPGSWWQWTLVAFLVGLGTNLHPVSGMAFTELLLSLLVLFQGINRKSLIALLTSGIAVVIGAWPTITNFFGGTGSEYTLVPFAIFYPVVRELITAVFSSERMQFNLFGHSLGMIERQALAWIYLVAMLIWGLVFLVAHVRKSQFVARNSLYLLLLLLQLPIISILTGFRAPILIIVVAIYWIIHIRNLALDHVDFWCLAFITLVCMYSFLGSFVLDIVWARFELWRLTPLVMEQMRTSRFVYLPLFVFVARFMKAIIEQLPGKRGIVIALCVAVLLGFAPHSLPGAVLAGLLILTELYGKGYVKDHWWAQFIFDVAMRTLLIRMVLFVAVSTSQRWSILALCLAASYSLLDLCGSYCGYGWRAAVLGSALSVLLLSPVLLLFNISLSSWAMDFAAVPARLWAEISPQALRQSSPGRADQLELYEWADKYTDVISLFYYDSLEFRFLAQRSLTHCKKDVGLGIYQGAIAVEFHNRYQELQEAYQDPGLLLSYARKYDVDYIVTTCKQAIHLQLPEAFRNSTYVVYSLE